VCGALVVQNSFNLPACNSTAVLTFANLKNVSVGSYLYSPTYGYLKITSFNAVTGEMVVVNECQAVNPPPGTVVPASTMFVLAGPPAFSGWNNWTTAITGNGTLAASGIVFNLSEYSVNNVTKDVSLRMHIDFTLAGSGTELYINLPVTVFGAVPNILIGHGTLNSPSHNYAVVSVNRRLALANEGTIRIDNSGAYAAGANTLMLSIIYRGV
jgi:hypothetical protein